MPPKPIHLQKATYQTPRHKALTNQKPRMEEETPAAVSSVTKEKSSKVSDLINRFEGGRYVMEFGLVCDSVYCVGIVGTCSCEEECWYCGRAHSYPR